MSRFSEHKANHQPVVSLVRTFLVEGFILHESSAPCGLMLDHATLTPLPGGVVRMVALDPAVGSDVFTADRGAYTVLSALNVSLPLPDSLHFANKAVYKKGVKRSDGGATFCVAVVDWDVDSGVVKASKAGDCEIWVRSSGIWVELLQGDMLSFSARKAWEANASSKSDKESHLLDHDILLGKLEDWIYPPLGAFENLTNLQVESYSGVDAVAVCTDGLLANESMFTNFSNWFDFIHDRPDSWEYDNPHGDLGIVVAWRKGTAPLAPLEF